MKIKKKRKKDNLLYKKNIKKSILILVMLMCIIFAMITYYLYAYNHKYRNYYSDDNRLVSYKVSDYVDVKGNMVYLKNIDNNIINYFQFNINLVFHECYHFLHFVQGNLHIPYMVNNHYMIHQVNLT